MFGRPGDENILWTTKCAICNSDAKTAYRSQVSSGLRCKSGGDYNFCSKECMDKFNRTRRCWFCRYPGELYDTGEGYMACNDYWCHVRYSCLDRFNLRKKCGLELENDKYWNDDIYHDYLNEHGEKPDKKINKKFRNEYLFGTREKAMKYINLVNKKYDDGDILYLATKNNDYELVKILLENGSKVGLNNALCEAMNNRNTDITKLLVEYGADPKEFIGVFGQDFLKELNLL